MKKAIIGILIILSAICSHAQQASVKLKTQQTFTVVPAVTATADSIWISSITDNGASVIATVVFYNHAPGGILVNPPRQMNVILWEGTDYANNRDWSPKIALARVKTLLNIK